MGHTGHTGHTGHEVPTGHITDGDNLSTTDADLRMKRSKPVDTGRPRQPAKRRLHERP
jgi:hypothetical protein